MLGILPLILTIFGILGEQSKYHAPTAFYTIKNEINNASYYNLPRFWTNSGLCPAQPKDLLSDGMLLNLEYIGTLPQQGITHLRIHWLLDLLEFQQFTQDGLPIYDYTHLNDFMDILNELNLYPVVEFMGNPGNVFNKNPNANDIMWQDLAYKFVKHYLSMY